jgi:P27 family predicted phage terminase small subunit
MIQSPTTTNKEKHRQKGLKTGDSKPIDYGIKKKSADNKRSKAIYEDLVNILTKLGVIDMADSVSMYIFATSFDEYIRCSEFIREKGVSYESETREGDVRHTSYPEVAAQGKAFDRIRSLLPQFYLTPSARLKVILDENEDKTSPLAMLLSNPRQN